jgi:hypothetical protein
VISSHALIAILALALCAAPGSDWRGAWDDLERLQTLVQGSEPARRLEAELSALASTREREARKVHDQAEAFRARVLAAQIARCRGASPPPLAAPGSAPEYGPREARFAAEVLAPGPLRAKAALAALGDRADPRGRSVRELALAVAREEYEARRLDGASALAAALAGDPADVAAALLSIRCASLAGRTEDARRQAAERGAAALAASPAIEYALLEAELALAREEPGAARRALGRALALGSTRAVLELAWRDLEEGEAARAAGILPATLRGNPAPGSADRSRAWICFALAQLPSYKADSIPDTPRAAGRAGGETRP